MTTDAVHAHDAAPSTDGRFFAYVFPCEGEDHAKIGFTRDPLGRISALHRRWFEFFALDGGWLVEAETQRDARDLELELRAPLKLHRAPAPLTVQEAAGGRTEWVRGANAALLQAVHALQARGHHVHPLRPWLRAVLLQRADRLFDWSAAWLPLDAEGVARHGASALAVLRDTLDAHAALDIDVHMHVPEEVAAWHQYATGWRPMSR